MKSFKPILFILALVGMLLVPQLRIAHLGAAGEGHAAHMSACEAQSNSSAASAKDNAIFCAGGMHGDHDNAASGNFHCQSCFMILATSDLVLPFSQHQKHEPVGHAQYVAIPTPPLQHPPSA